MKVPCNDCVALRMATENKNISPRTREKLKEIADDLLDTMQKIRERQLKSDPALLRLKKPV